MNKEHTTAIHMNIATNSTVPLIMQKDERPSLIKKIGKTTYRVRIHFSTTS